MMKLKGSIEVFGTGCVLMAVFVEVVECEGFGGFGVKAIFIEGRFWEGFL
jgi:hypothetical protein